MSNGGTTVALSETLRVFEELEDPTEPLTSSEVAGELGCARRTAYGKLEKLAEEGELKSKKAGARSRVWWRLVSDSTQNEERLDGAPSRQDGAEERLAQIARAASHDLREPLRMVTNYQKLLERRHQDDLDDDARSFLAFAVDGAEQIEEMLDDLLAYARIDAGEHLPQSTDSAVVLDAVVTSFRREIEERDAEIVRGDLPTVVADESQLERLFSALVSNALTYGGDRPRIEVGAKRQDTEWKFWVTDDGIGIDPSDRERIFDLFERLHTQEEYPGTGAGLAIAREIVTIHGGRIWIESEPGGGSNFYFTIPVSDAEDGSTPGATAGKEVMSRE